MEHGRSYLMHECQVMASGGERSPTIINPMLAPSSCHRKQASLGANDESAHPFTELFIGSGSAVATAGSLATVCYDFASRHYERLQPSNWLVARRPAAIDDAAGRSWGASYFAAVRCKVVFAGEASIQEVVSSQRSASISLRSFSGPTTIGTVNMTLWVRPSKPRHLVAS
jgi:hypothetical protein